VPLQAEVDGVGAVLDGGHQAGPIAGRRQQLGLLGAAAGPVGVDSRVGSAVAMAMLSAEGTAGGSSRRLVILSRLAPGPEAGPSNPRNLATALGLQEDVSPTPWADPARGGDFMRIAITGASGFLGRYLVAHLAARGHDCVCWHRVSGNIAGLDVPDEKITWIIGELGDAEASRMLVEGCDAVVHAALSHPGGGFMGGEGDLTRFVETNVVGTIRLIEEARRAGVGRFVFISTCAVHDVILPDRPLDETHPTWAKSHYGAHKAAIEAFVSSYGRGHGYPICALRPTGIYGLAYPPRDSKWFDLIRAVVRGEDVDCRRGGKEVHARTSPGRSRSC
jgi:hypothetical protein